MDSQLNLNLQKHSRSDRSFADQLKNNSQPDTAEKGKGYFVIWGDGRAIVGYKNKQDAINFIEQGGRDVVKVEYRDTKKGERIRNTFIPNPDKSANILDEPRETLDPSIWDIGKEDLPFLKPDIKVKIVKNFINYISRFGGYKYPEKWIKNMFYTGSTATYTYTDKSDIDIHIIVDWKEMLRNNPEKEKDSLEQVWRALHDVFWWTLNKEKLPGTKHPLTFYVVKPGEESEILEAKEEIYDIGHDVWLIPPGDTIALPEEAMTLAVSEASEIISKIEQYLSNAKQSVIDYSMLKLLSKLHTNSETPVILQKLNEKLQSIDEELIKLKDTYALLKQKRQEGFELGKPIVPSESKNYTLGNIIYKLVERYKLLEILREIKRITDAKPLKHDQVDSISDTLSLASTNIKMQRGVKSEDMDKS